MQIEMQREGVRDRKGSNDEWLVGPAAGNYWPLQLMQDTRAARCIESTTKSNRPQTTDHYTQPLPSLAGWTLPLPLSLYPLLSLLPAPAALCVTADLRCLAVPATPETRFDRS